MDSNPVFQTQYDLGLWKKLSNTGSSRFRGKKTDTAEEVADEVLAYRGTVHSAVLVRLMDILYDRGSERLRSILPDLSAKRRSSDCAPAFEASLLYRRMGDREGAVRMADSARDGMDIPLKSAVLARLFLDAENREAARKELIRGRCSNPLDQNIYKLLEEADPAGGWMYVRNMELINAGKETVLCGSEEDSPNSRLYTIYCRWFGGEHDEATKALIESEEYVNGNPAYLLAAARMSADESDWYSAEILYDRITGQGCTFVLCEAAEVCMNGGKNEKALSLYRDAEAEDPQSPLVMKGLIEVYSRMGRKEDAAQCIHNYLDTEYVGLDAFLECAEKLVEDGMNADAEPILKKILMNYPNDVRANILKSKNDRAMGNFPGALEAATAAVRSDGRNPEARLQRARILVSSGKTERALKEAQIALKYDPENIDIMILIKDIYTAQGNRAAVLDMCERILEIDPENAGIMLESSEAKMAMGDREGSLAAFRKTIAADRRPENFIAVISSLIKDRMYEEAAELCYEFDSEYGSLSIVRRLRGNAEYQMGEYLKASVSFASAAAADPFSPVIWHSKGMADEAAGDIYSAEEAYNRAVLMDLDEPEFWLSKSSVQEKKGDLRGAVESINRVIELNPECSYALVKKGMLFARSGKYTEANYFLDMAIMVDVWNKDIYQIKKEVCIQAGMYEEAINVCMDINNIDPTDIYAITDAAECMMKLGNRSGALSFINEKLIKDPSSIPLLMVRKNILTSMGNYPELIDTCFRILEKDPNNRSVKTDLAHAYLSNGDSVSAEKLFAELEMEESEPEPEPEPVKEEPEPEPEPVPTIDGRDDRALFEIAKSLYSTGDLRGAARMADRALALNPNNTEYVIFRSDVYSADGDLRGAEAVIAQGLKLSPDNAELWERDGDLKASLGDIHGAMTCYQNAIDLGGGCSSGLYVKLGDAKEKTGDLDGAVSEFSMAVTKCGEDNGPRIRLANAQYLKGDIKEADRTVDTVLSDEPGNAEAMVLKAKIYSERRNPDGVAEMYRNLLRTPDPDVKLLEEMSEILMKSGRPQEASVMAGRAANVSGGKAAGDVPVSVKRHAESLLRRAYATKRSLDDPGIENVLDLDYAVFEAVMDYLSDISEYGEIIPGTPEYERLEKLSHNAVMRANLTDIEKDPIISIPAAYVAGGSNDSDEAKTLVSYVYSAMNSARGDGQVPEDVKGLASEEYAGMSVFDIMKSTGLGVYGAASLKKISS
jgi:tetratricopeptide (TPR) repeat protein